MRSHLKLLSAVAGAVLLISSPAEARTAKEETSPTGEKLICKKWTEVGSLVRKRKQCMTKADWEKVALSQRTGAQKLADELTGRCAQQGGVCP